MKKFVSFILIMIFALSFMAISVNAQCTLSVTSSKKEVYVGEEFKIYLTFSGSESIESADGSVEFDNSKFAYVEAESTLGASFVPTIAGKTITFSDFYNGAATMPKTYKVTITFKAIAVGKGTISVTSSDIGGPNNNSIGSPKDKETTVSVKQENKSNNANLSSLTVPAGCTLVPKFSKDVTSYTCTVPYSVTKFPMDWTTEDKDAKAVPSALQTLKVGENSRTVTVTAPDGTQKKYTVKIIREKQTVTPTPSGKPTSEATPTATATATATPTAAPLITVIDGNQYNIVEKITLQLPENFQKSTYVYDSKEIEVAVLGDACLVQLFDGTRDMFFVYDKAEQKFTPFRTVKSTEKNLTVLDKKPELSIELAEQHIVIGDGEYVGWTSEIFGEGYYILNVMNSNGENYIALYCQEDGSIQKLSLKLLEGGVVAEPTETPETTASPTVTEMPEATIVVYTPFPTEKANDKGFFDKIPLEYVGIAVCVLLFIAIVIIVIILAVGNSKSKKSEHDWGFEETTGFDFVVEDANGKNEDSDDFE